MTYQTEQDGPDDVVDQSSIIRSNVIEVFRQTKADWLRTSDLQFALYELWPDTYERWSADEVRHHLHLAGVRLRNVTVDDRVVEGVKAEDVGAASPVPVSDRRVRNIYMDRDSANVWAEADRVAAVTGQSVSKIVAAALRQHLEMDVPRAHRDFALLQPRAAGTPGAGGDAVPASEEGAVELTGAVRE